MRRALRLVLRTAGGLWSLLMIMVMAASVALSVAMTLLPGVLGAVSSAVEAVSGRKSVLSQQQAREARLNQRLMQADADLSAERSARRAETRALRQQIAAAPAETVTYRGQRMAMREAVHDTATRVTRRAGLAAGRNIGSMAGEALPVVGVGVIVAATAWELSDSCEMIRELRELDAAFNPADPISEDEICGITPPTRDEVWQAVRSSPEAAWRQAQTLYADLPDMAGSGWNPMNWFDGE